MARMGQCSTRKDDTLARGLGVELGVGFFGLIKIPAIAEQGFDIYVMIRDELGTVSLTLAGKGPGTDQRDLAAQQVRAHVQSHVATLTYITHRAPRPDSLNSGPTG